MIHVYHPNKRITGFAASFWYSDRDDAVYATLIKQDGWDDKADNGTFKASLQNPEKNVNIKLSFTEVAAILDCIERNRPFNTFHDGDQKPKTIGFTPWMSKATTDNPSVQQGYSFSIKVTDKNDRDYENPYYIGLSFAEGREIREYLLYIFHKHFKRVEDSRVNKVQAKVNSSPAKTVQQSDSLVDL